MRSFGVFRRSGNTAYRGGAGNEGQRTSLLQSPYVDLPDKSCSSGGAGASTDSSNVFQNWQTTHVSKESPKGETSECNEWENVEPTIPLLDIVSDKSKTLSSIKDAKTMKYIAVFQKQESRDQEETRDDDMETELLGATREGVDEEDSVVALRNYKAKTKNLSKIGGDQEPCNNAIQTPRVFFAYSEDDSDIGRKGDVPEPCISPGAACSPSSISKNETPYPVPGYVMATAQALRTKFQEDPKLERNQKSSKNKKSGPQNGAFVETTMRMVVKDLANIHIEKPKGVKYSVHDGTTERRKTSSPSKSVRNRSTPLAGNDEALLSGEMKLLLTELNMEQQDESDSPQEDTLLLHGKLLSSLMREDAEEIIFSDSCRSSDASEDIRYMSRDITQSKVEERSGPEKRASPMSREISQPKVEERSGPEKRASPMPREISQPKVEERSGPEKRAPRMSREISHPKVEERSGPEKRASPMPREISEPKVEERSGPEKRASPMPREITQPKVEERSGPEKRASPMPREITQPKVEERSGPEKRASSSSTPRSEFNKSTTTTATKSAYNSDQSEGMPTATPTPTSTTPMPQERLQPEVERRQSPTKRTLQPKVGRRTSQPKVEERRGSTKRMSSSPPKRPQSPVRCELKAIKTTTEWTKTVYKEPKPQVEQLPLSRAESSPSKNFQSKPLHGSKTTMTNTVDVGNKSTGKTTITNILEIGNKSTVKTEKSRAEPLALKDDGMPRSHGLHDSRTSTTETTEIMRKRTAVKAQNPLVLGTAVIPSPSNSLASLDRLLNESFSSDDDIVGHKQELTGLLGPLDNQLCEKDNRLDSTRLLVFSGENESVDHEQDSFLQLFEGPSNGDDTLDLLLRGSATSDKKKDGQNMKLPQCSGAQIHQSLQTDGGGKDQLGDNGTGRQAALKTDVPQLSPLSDFSQIYQLESPFSGSLLMLTPSPVEALISPVLGAETSRLSVPPINAALSPVSRKPSTLDSTPALIPASLLQARRTQKTPVYSPRQGIEPTSQFTSRQGNEVKPTFPTTRQQTEVKSAVSPRSTPSKYLSESQTEVKPAVSPLSTPSKYLSESQTEVKPAVSPRSTPGKYLSEDSSTIDAETTLAEDARDESEDPRRLDSDESESGGTNSLNGESGRITLDMSGSVGTSALVSGSGRIALDANESVGTSALVPGSGRITLDGSESFATSSRKARSASDEDTLPDMDVWSSFSRMFSKGVEAVRDLREEFSDILCRDQASLRSSKHRGAPSPDTEISDAKSRPHSCSPTSGFTSAESETVLSGRDNRYGSKKGEFRTSSISPTDLGPIEEQPMEEKDEYISVESPCDQRSQHNETSDDKAAATPILKSQRSLSPIDTEMEMGADPKMEMGADRDDGDDKDAPRSYWVRKFSPLSRKKAKSQTSTVTSPSKRRIFMRAVRQRLTPRKNGEKSAPEEEGREATEAPSVGKPTAGLPASPSKNTQALNARNDPGQKQKEENQDQKQGENSRPSHGFFRKFLRKGGNFKVHSPDSLPILVLERTDRRSLSTPDLSDSSVPDLERNETKPQTFDSSESMSQKSGTVPKSTARTPLHSNKTSKTSPAENDISGDVSPGVFVRREEDSPTLSHNNETKKPISDDSLESPQESSSTEKTTHLTSVNRHIRTFPGTTGNNERGNSYFFDRCSQSEIPLRSMMDQELDSFSLRGGDGDDHPISPQESTKTTKTTHLKRERRAPFISPTADNNDILVEGGGTYFSERRARSAAILNQTQHRGSDRSVGGRDNDLVSGGSSIYGSAMNEMGTIASVLERGLRRRPLSKYCQLPGASGSVASWTTGIETNNTFQTRETLQTRESFQTRETKDAKHPKEEGSVMSGESMEGCNLAPEFQEDLSGLCGQKKFFGITLRD